MTAFIKALLDISVTASYLAAAVILLRLVLKKAPKFLTILLWGLVAIRLIIPVFPESSLSVIPNPSPITNSVTDEKEEAVTPPVIEEEEKEEENTDVPPTVQEAPVTPVKPTVPHASTATEKASATPWNTVFWIWISGFCLMLCYALVSWLRVLRSVKGAEKEEGRIWISGGTSTPFILGIVRPRIYLPEGLSDEDRLYVMTHERAHLKRCDHLWKPFGFLLLSLHWFNPLLWVSYILLCRDIELAADEKAIKKLGEEHKKPYSHALISCAANRALIAACPLAFGETSIKDRIKRVLNYKRPAFWIIITAAVACIVTGVLFLTNPKESTLTGTWYGNDAYTAGSAFTFNKDGTGVYTLRWDDAKVDILWEAQDGKLRVSCKESTVTDVIPHNLRDCSFTVKGKNLELYTEGESPVRNVFSRKKNTYGGDEKLVSESYWQTEDGKSYLIFREYGVIEGELDGKLIYELYRAKKGKLTVLYAEEKAKAYPYTVEDKVLTVTIDGNEMRFVPDGNTKDLAGEWYGTCIQSVGTKIVFEDGGDGVYYGDYGVFKWRTEGDKLIIEDAPQRLAANSPYTFIFKGEELVLIPNGGKNPTQFYSKTDPRFGGVHNLVRNENGAYINWKNEDGSIRINFENVGIVTGTFNGKHLNNVYRAKDNVLEIFTDGETKSYRYTLENNVLTLKTDNENVVLTAERPDYTGLPVIGTWYSMDVKNALTVFTFTEDGKGGFEKNFSACGFNWIDKNGVITYFGSFYHNTPDGTHGDGVVAHAKIKYEIKDGVMYFNGSPYSKTKPDFGGDEAFVNIRDIFPQVPVGFMESAEWKKRYIFHENGSLEIWTYDTAPIEYEDYHKYPTPVPEYFAWRTNAEKNTLYIISESGETEYSYTVTENGISLTAKNGYSILLKGIVYGDEALPTLSQNGWTLDGDTVTISGEGEMSAPPDWNAYKTRIKTVVIEKGVTSVSAKAFSGYTALESVTIPDTVTAIYHSAFEGCTSLNGIALPASITTIQEFAFSGCTSLTVMHLPSDLHTLNGNIFDGCTSLEQIFLPINMVNVCAPVFANCPALKDLVLSSYNDNFRLIGEALYNKDTLICYVKSEDDGWDGFSLPDITKYIGKSAFANCKELKHIYINEGVTEIGADAFNGCTALEEITIPASVEKISKNAFYGCIALKTVNLSEGITQIDDGAFYGTALKEILFPDSVTEIGEQAFGDCDLLSVVLPPNLKYVEGTMFDGCNRLKNVTLPENVSSISAPAFANCPSLKELKLQGENKKLIYLDGVLFSKSGDNLRLLYCPKDKEGEYAIPANVSVICEGAFWNCVSLTKVSFPEGIDIARIPDKMFMCCSSLKEVTFASDLERLEGNVFYGCRVFTNVRYGGTMEEWNALPKHPYWRGEDVRTVKQVICKDGIIKIKPYAQCWTLDENGTFTLLFDGGDAYTPLWEDIKPKIKKVIIKDGVTKIPSNAFDECVNLESVTIPDSVTSMNGGGFSGCTSLKEITLPDGIKVVGGFSRCTSLEKVKLPAKLESLGQYAFSDCTSLKSITLPDTLKDVAARAFINCTALESIHIPDNVTEIGLEAFSCCTALKTVTGCKNVKSVDYAAFLKCAISDTDFLKNATEVDKYAFEACTNLKNAVLAEGVSIIEMGTFAFSAVETVSVPKSVKMIRSLAFSSCDKLKTIVYGGTAAEWNEITLDVQWLGEDFSATVTVKCTDGTLTAKNVEGMVDYGP